MNSQHFNSKILLFGEHILMHGADSLAIPYDRYYGYFELCETIDKDWNSFVDYLQPLDYINTDRLISDIARGLQFRSTIGIGKGLGSSGALSAAVYSQYSTEPKSDTALLSLKSRLANIESYFHGSSSGIDPLVSLLNKGVTIQKGNINLVDDIQKPSFNIYLWDSKKARNAKDYILKFKQSMQNSASLERMISLSNICVDNLLNGKVDGYSSIKEMSLLQYRELPDFFVPEASQFMTANSCVKLCGAGGGGYYLIFSKNEIKDLHKEEDLFQIL